MVNPLENKANALWHSYANKEGFWQQYNQLIKQAKKQSQSVSLLLPYIQQQTLAYQKVQNTSYYDLMLSAPINFKKIFIRSLVIPSTITAVFFLPLGNLMGFNLAFLLFCLKVFGTAFGSIFMIDLYNQTGQREYIFTLQFYEDCLVYLNHQGKKRKVLYRKIDQLRWQKNGKMVLTEQNKQRHTLYYPMTSKSQSLAIRNLLEAIVQHNAMLKQ